MGQVTIYLGNEIESQMNAAARISDMSVSKWITNIIKEKVSME